MTKIIIKEGKINGLLENQTAKLSKYVLKGIETNKHSLGIHPCFPPSEESNFDDKLINNRFKQILDTISKFKDIESLDINVLKRKLKEVSLSIKKIEKDHKEELIKVCKETINKIFHIPENSIDLDINIVDKIDNLGIELNLSPTETSGYEYESVNDMNDIEKCIYKRRFINSLIQGASNYLSESYDLYLSEIYKINPSLPELYAKGMVISDVLYFVDKCLVSTDLSKRSGIVKVVMSNTKPTKIIVQGINFPSILNEVIKGFMELFSTYGLPDDKNKADFVISKSDFLHAEPWDIRFGYPLWEKVFGFIEKDKYIYIPNLYVELISFDNDEFFNKMKEILANTKHGKKYINDILNDIETNVKIRDFNDLLLDSGENDYYNIEELDNLTI